MISVSSVLTFYLDLATYSTSMSMVKIVAILLGLNLVAATTESSWCSGLFEGEPQQQHIRPAQVIQVGWLHSQDDSTTAIKGCGQLPRATWTIEPTPEGVNNTQIWMLPPDLGRAVFEDGGDSDFTFIMKGIEVNRTALDNISNESEIGVLIQVPKDQFIFFEMYDSPFRVNIAPGFTNILSLYCYQGATRPDDICGYDIPLNWGLDVENFLSWGEIKKDMTGLGAVVRADLSTVTVETGLTVSVNGDGVDFSLKLPEGYPLNGMSFQGINSRYSIKGNVNCTETCYLFGGSSSLCTGAHCFSQLVVDGDIAGTVSVNPFIYSQQSDEVVLVANVSAQGGCDHFDHSESFRSNFRCIDGAAANAAVEVEPFPCAMQKQEMKTIDVVECPTQNDFADVCQCFVPSAATCPIPAPTSPASFGVLLSKSTSFGLTGILCYILEMLVF